MRKNKKDIGDDMLDRDGMIVEPDVRDSIKKYFKIMKMRETNYHRRTTFFSNPYEDPRLEDYTDPDDPVGLKLMKKQQELEDEIRGENLIRNLVSGIIKESEEDISNFGIAKVRFKAGTITDAAIIYSIPLLDKAIKSGVKSRDRDRELCVISGVQWGKPYSHDGPCNYDYVVRRSVTSRPEWGRKAYLAAMYYISRFGQDTETGLGPDRQGVEPGAEKAWEKLQPYLNAKPYDDIKAKRTPPPEDDCTFIQPHNALLNSSYTLKNGVPGDISRMIQNGTNHFSELLNLGGKKMVDAANDHLYLDFDILFLKHYSKS